MIKILIADDHPVVREGLRQILARSSDMTVGGEALNGQEVMEKIAAEEWDVLVLDIGMPGRDGLEVLKDVHREQPDLPVLVLSMYPEEQVAVRALKAGAAGYMNKETAPKELVNAIKKIYDGGKYVSAALAEKLASSLDTHAKAEPHETLSDREFQVFRLLASGKEANEIAEELFISVKTVRTYRDRIHEKLHLKNDVELARYAMKYGLLE
ncbi:response regulator transcription factor [candidate division KSB1 bacterium]|nr:response regulator transcription factor [candidate division KSB1 bacterium]